MSFNRENVIWQSADGSWNRGFYEVLSSFAPYDGDYDAEWDVDYNMDVFEWVRTGLPSKNSAHKETPGGNPGVVYVLPYAENTDDQIAEYDIMALRLTNPTEYAHRLEEHEKNVKAREKAEEEAYRGALLDTLKESDFFVGEEVILTMNDGSVRSHLGRVVKEGDWITVQSSRLQGSGYHRIYNLKTKTLDPRVHDMKKDTYSR